MDSSIFATISNGRKLIMKLLSILTLLVCSECNQVIKEIFDMVSYSEDASKPK